MSKKVKQAVIGSIQMAQTLWSGNIRSETKRNTYKIEIDYEEGILMIQAKSSTI